MKKLKKLLPAIVSVILAFVLVFAFAGCGSCNPEGPDTQTPTVDRIEANVSLAKSQFYTEQEFTSEGLRVEAVLTDDSRKDVTAEAKIDSSAFDSSKEGDYAIKVSYQEGDKNFETSYTVRVLKLEGAVLSGLNLILDDVKTTYKIKENFSSDGLKVYAVMGAGDTSYEIPVATTDAALEIDSSGFDKENVGEYTIFVTYTRDGVARHANYMVGVNSVISGSHSIELRKDKTSFSINDAAFTLDDVHVYEVGADGITYDAENNITNKEITTEEGLTFSYYMNGEKLDEAGIAAIKTTGGTYQIGVVKEYVEGDESYEMRDFVTFYIVNGLQSLTFKQAGSTTSQGVGDEDKITSTWKFTLRYTDGTEKEVGVPEVVITNFKPDEVTSPTATATATYTEIIGGEKQSVSTTVTYTIENDYVLTGEVTYKITVKAPENPKEGDEFVKTWTVTDNGQNDRLPARDYDNSITFSNSKHGLPVKATNSMKLGDSGPSFTGYAENKKDRELIFLIGNNKKIQTVKVTAYISVAEGKHTTRKAFLSKSMPQYGDETMTLPGNTTYEQSFTFAAANTLYKWEIPEINVASDNALRGNYYFAGTNTIMLWCAEIEYTVNYDATV